MTEKVNEIVLEPKKFFLRKRHQQAPILNDFAKLLGRRESKLTNNKAVDTIDDSYKPQPTNTIAFKSLITSGILQKQIKDKLTQKQEVKVKKDLTSPLSSRPLLNRDLTRTTPRVTLHNFERD